MTMNAHNAPPSPASAEVFPFTPGAEPVAEAPARRRWLKPALIALAVGLAGVAGWKAFAPAGKPPAAAAASNLPEVTVIVPGSTMMADTVVAPGSIAARRDAAVGVQGEGGRVVRVLVEPGQRVAAGQVLAQIDRQVQTQEIAQLSASVRQAEAEARLAEANLARAESLVAKGFISRADIDQRTATRDGAVARVGVARAQLAAARERAERLDVRSPAAGLILARNIEAGQVVGPGNGGLFRLAEGGMLEMRAQVAEQDLARLQPGRTAVVTPVGSSERYQGKVWLIDPLIDPANRQGIVRIQLDYAPGLRVGAFARARIDAGQASRPLLPQSAVLADAQGNFVMVVGKDDRVERRAIEVGTIGDNGVGIANGLNGTERVVASAGAFLKPGDKIKPVMAAAATR
ncbi:efflux transporter periplasmic adaptor subunit [Sandarakinorhabdus cyanobacteriorum]|uniref:Efflux transporter periplasmic adaptor subunit n=1 Tax=Sandarakinorhabdus cyanobacteriorum TaxID=1981098 RepID=A0A255ZAG3_9SPHN|nr:efflux RND transporter periplasmic adaptor subunit [Sandarakinorhabdus cyanobacteriorum]OYQ37600.1 efflux transporter periplasmic adaptor subunit [Sandarakinorhabdus cyanobacteriorum]